MSTNCMHRCLPFIGLGQTFFGPVKEYKTYIVLHRCTEICSTTILAEIQTFIKYLHRQTYFKR